MLSVDGLHADKSSQDETSPPGFLTIARLVRAEPGPRLLKLFLAWL
jgi:hypothetical protein